MSFIFSSTQSHRIFLSAMSLFLICENFFGALAHGAARSVSLTGNVFLDGQFDNSGVTIQAQMQNVSASVSWYFILLFLLCGVFLSQKKRWLAASFSVLAAFSTAWAAWIATSDSEGFYSIELAAAGSPEAGVYRVIFTKTGYDTAFLDVQIDPDATVDIYVPNVILYATDSPTPTATPSGCILGTDTDEDRLDDCYETNTGTYNSVTDTGTDPSLRDTDGDGMSDGDEALGTLDGLDLPGLGVSPVHQNILFEYDWFDDSVSDSNGGSCGSHSHKPSLGVMDRVADAFAAAPILNPDGITGIVAIQDYGQGDAFTGGNLIPDADGVLSGGVSGSEFLNYKATHFASNRKGYFHYVILPHYYNNNSLSSGQAEILGDDMIVSLYCYNSDRNVANTIVHEVGHNLGLYHGGDSSCNYKPNYNSIMNYKYQFPGIDTDCNPDPDGRLDYSNGSRITLNESALNENLGTCGSSPWDWNGDSGIQNSVVFDINADDTSQSSACGGTLTILTDYDDWGNINLGAIINGDRLQVEVVDCNNRASSK